MLRKIGNWYRNLPVIKQLIVTWLAYCVYWLLFMLFANILIVDQTHSFPHYLSYSVFMSLFMTVFSKWPKVKNLFRDKKQASGD